MPTPRDPGPTAPSTRPSRSPQADEIVTHMQRLTTESQKVAQAFASRHGLGHIDLEALLHVMQAERDGDPVTAGGLGELLGVTSGAATGVIDRLEKVGHVHRSRESTDRRRVTLRPAPDTRERAREFLAFAGTEVAATVRTTGPDELRAVSEFLDRLTGAATRANHRLAGRRTTTRRD